MQTEGIDEVVRALLPTFEALYKSVSNYPTLGDAEIDHALTRDGVIPRQISPSPFPRDGSEPLPREHETVDYISKEIDRHYPGRTSVGYRRVKIRDALVKTIAAQNTAERIRIAAMALTLLCEHEQTWQFIIPIENLVLEIGQLRVGPVTFYPTRPNDRFLKWRTHEVRRQVNFYARLAPLPSLLDPVSQADSWAVVQAPGDLYLAEERAFDVFEEAIDVLRLYLAYSPAYLLGGANFGVSGQASLSHSTIGASLINNFGHRVRWSHPLERRQEQMYGAAAKYKATVNSDVRKTMRRDRFKRLSQTVGKQDKTELELRLFRALRWASDAVSSQQDVDRFLKWIYAIDGLLGNDGQSTTETADRCAFLLGNNKTQRRKRKAEIKKLFKERGVLAHGGVSSGFQGSIFAAETHCRSLLKAFIFKQLRLQTNQALSDWFEERKFRDWELLNRLLSPPTKRHFPLPPNTPRALP